METKVNIAVCVSYLMADNIDRTIKWYERIGFRCTETNHIWKPDCELNWAKIGWNGAAFMIGPCFLIYSATWDNFAAGRQSHSHNIICTNVGGNAFFDKGNTGRINQRPTTGLILNV